MLAHRNRTIFAQHLFPFAAGPAPAVSLADAWAVVLELLRRAAARFSFQAGDLVRAAAAQERQDWPSARRGDRAAIVRLRVMRAAQARAVDRLPLP
jgi:hypothetical protein